MEIPRIKFILCCQCKDMPAFAKSAFRTLCFSNNIGCADCSDTPQIFRSSAGITKLVYELDNLSGGKDVVDYIRALQKSKEKYALYFSLYTDGQIDEVWNLKNGTKVF